MQEQAQEIENKDTGPDSTAQGAEGAEPLLPRPPGHVLKPWAKLAKKILRKTGLDLPPMMLPLLAIVERNHQESGIEAGLRPWHVMQLAGLDPQTTKALIVAGILEVVQAPHNLTRNDGEPAPHALRVHRRLAELLHPMLHETDAAVQWAVETMSHTASPA